jgi:hypothetical protein
LKTLFINSSKPDKSVRVNGNPDTYGPSKAPEKKKLIIKDNTNEIINENIKYCFFAESEFIFIY